MRTRRSIWRRTPAWSWLALLVMFLLPVASARAAPAPHIDRLTLVVPAAAGGGWDLTAKAIKSSLEADGLVDQVSIVRYPGAGGLIGLSQFVARHRGDGHVLLVGGLVMLGAALRDEAAVSLHDVTPIARLTGEWDVLALPATSSLRSFADLAQALRINPAGVRFVGGALGGPDQGLAFAIAGQLGVPYDDVEYYGRAGGRRVTEALLQGRGDVGLGGYAEFAPALDSGAVKLLAVAAPHRIAGLAAPTLRELGVNATMMNWRAVFAPPGLGAREQDALAGLIAAMERSSAWQAQLARNRWTDSYLDGLAFSQFLGREQGRWLDVINPPRRVGELVVPDAGGTPRRLAAALALGVLLLAAFALWLAGRLRQRRRAADALQSRCAELSQQLGDMDIAANTLVRSVIDEEFGEWKLSSAEADIAWFMLRGLPLKEIAQVRGTSERTVRQQAQAIYRKAGLDGRSDLAGRVLERFI